MSQEYSNPERESELTALPDIEVFQLTAEEQVQQDEELMWDAGKRFPLMHMNSRDRDKASGLVTKEWVADKLRMRLGQLQSEFRQAVESLGFVF